MKEWLKWATSTFVGGGAALALLAIPTYIWIPREFDGIKAELAATKSAALEASDRSSQSLAVVNSVSTKIDTLVVAIARMDAKPLGTMAIQFKGNALQLSAGASAVDSGFASLLPEDLLKAIVETGSLSGFSYSNFDGRDWVFVDRASFNKLNANQQEQIQASFQRSNASFIVE